MTTASMSGKIEPTPPSGATVNGNPPPRRSMLGAIGMAVLGRWGARFGVIWIAILIFLAVFAPFIANSHPVLLLEGGRWTSPLLQHLYPVDAILLVGALSGIGLWLMWPIGGKRRFLIWLVILVLAVVILPLVVQPPRVVVLSQYREKIEATQQSGESIQVIHTLIPFSPIDRLRDQQDSRLLRPDRSHWLGTTANGEDMASRMIHAARIALAIGFIATGIAVLIGIVIGGVMGYFSGWVDLLGMRLVEVFAAIPVIFLLIAFVAFYGRNLYLLMMIIGATGWVGYALFIRAEFLKLRRQDFVQAARACGLPLRSILFKHMLPNGVTPVLVSASFGVASAILMESTLSFLGLGLVEEPSWGQLLEQARGVGGSFYWWIALYPGLAIFLTVFAYNLVGEAMRDAIDPHTKRAVA